MCIKLLLRMPISLGPLSYEDEAKGEATLTVPIILKLKVCVQNEVNCLERPQKYLRSKHIGNPETLKEEGTLTVSVSVITQRSSFIKFGLNYFGSSSQNIPDFKFRLDKRPFPAKEVGSNFASLVPHTQKPYHATFHIDRISNFRIYAEHTHKQ